MTPPAPPEVDMIRHELSDCDAGIRVNAATAATYLSAWGWHDTSALACDLARVLASDPYPRVREAAAEALGYTYSPEAMPALLRGLEDVDPRVRVSCERGLHHIFDSV